MRCESNIAYGYIRQMALGISGPWIYTDAIASSTMSSSLHLLDLPFDCETSVAHTVHQLNNTELHVSRSFKLDSACGSLTTGICSHDPKSPCQCQLVVLLVTDFGAESGSIILHSYNGKTELYLDEPKTTTRQGIKERIIQALVF